MSRPGGVQGLWHVALNVRDLEAAERFYVELLGFAVEWRPDADNLYLCSGRDNLALHRVPAARGEPHGQALDHIGLVLTAPEDVDAWFEWLRDAGVAMATTPRTHRDGARSFYCYDPDGNKLQMLYHPPLAPAA